MYWPRILVLGVALAIAAAAPTSAEDTASVQVRVGDHAGFGRLVLDFPRRLEYRLTQQGDRLTLQFDTPVTIGAAPILPRNFVSFTGAAGEAEIVLAPGSDPHFNWVARHLVIDAMDPGGTASASRKPARTPGERPPAAAMTHATAPTNPTPTGTAAATSTATAAAIPPATKRAATTAEPPASVAATPQQPATPPVGAAPTVAPPVDGTPANATPSPSSPAPAAAADPAPATPPAAEPVAVAAVIAPPVAGNTDSIMMVPFDATAGAAAFRRGDTAMLVFDERRPIDLAAEHDDKVFGNATVQLTPTATIIRFPLPAGMQVAMSRAGTSWLITVTATPPRLSPISPHADAGRVTFPTDAAAQVVTVVDPLTGAPLLIGTVRRAGVGIAAAHRAAEFVLLPTWQGVAILPLSDRLVLRASQSGFGLSAQDGRLAVSTTSPDIETLTAAIGLTRRFDFSSLPPPALAQLLQTQMAADAAAPPLGRATLRRKAAQTMLSLGLVPEAQALLQLAATDDPVEAADLDNLGLGAIAAVLADRLDQADDLADPRLSGSDETELWRAIRAAKLQEGSPRAAAEFAATVPLAASYPDAIRAKLLPLVLETMIEGGEADAAALFLAQHKDDASLALARGMLQQTTGDLDAALATYDAIAVGTDRLARARAATRAVELRLASGRIDKKAAADALDRLLYVWRGDWRELAQRERTADLRAETDNWRPALALLRESEALFPDKQPAIHVRLKDTFASLLHDDAADSLPPLELVALLEENADLLPDGPDGEAMEARLADRLLALDLPNRAGPLLDKLMRSAPTDAGRANFGTRLAALRNRDDDAAGALAALSASAAPDLPPELAQRRALLTAAAQARRGNVGQAMAALDNIDSAAADEARAGILETSKDWSGAEHALANYVAKTVPPDGNLNDAQRRSLLRLATAASQAGDAAALAALRQRELTRMASGPVADMFRLLTAEPVRGVADLPRAGHEAAMAHDLAGQLKKLPIQ